jgi:4-hydroxy-tetrahydrodipicolinate reductase
MSEPITAIVYGFGTAGRRLCSELLDDEGFDLRGVVDIDPDLTGRDVGAALGREVVNVEISSHDDVHAAEPADVSFVLTTSYLEEVLPVVKAAIRVGTNVVTTSEELFYPVPAYESEFDELDSLAREHGVSVLGQGMNPGFIMDLLPATVSGICIDVDYLRAVRTANLAPYDTARTRFGAGLPVAEYRDRLSKGEIQTHVGLEQSLHFLADAFELEFDDVVTIQRPIIADKPRQTPHVDIPAGTVAGIRQQAAAVIDGISRIDLELRVEAFDEDGDRAGQDGIYVDGTPNVDLTVEPSISSVESTIGHTINAASAVIDSPPGYRTLLDLPVITFS